MSSAIGRCPGARGRAPSGAVVGARLCPNARRQKQCARFDRSATLAEPALRLLHREQLRGASHAGGIGRGKGDQQELRGGEGVAQRVMADRDVATEMGDPFIEAVAGSCPETAPAAGTRGRRTAAAAARRARRASRARASHDRTRRETRPAATCPYNARKSSMRMRRVAAAELRRAADAVDQDVGVGARLRPAAAPLRSSRRGRSSRAARRRRRSRSAGRVCRSSPVVSASTTT